MPTAGPVIVTPNHHNSLVDAMLIVAAFPRPVRVLVKAGLFHHPLIGPFLRLMGGVPVQRRLEAGDDPNKNVEMFQAVDAALHAGGAILIFPEGRTQPQPVLLPLRTGAARIFFEAEGAPGGRGGVALLPIGLVFHDPGTFRSASVLVNVGEPVATADLLELARDQPERAVRTLTARLTEAIRAQIVEAEDQHTLHLLEGLETAWWEEAARRGERPAGPGDVAQSLAWRQQVARGAARLAEREPHRVAELRRRLERYRAHLDEVGVTSEQLGRPYTARGVTRYVVENACWLALGWPLALGGTVCHFLPYWLTGRVVHWLGATAEEEATDKMAAGSVIYPALWAVEGWLVWRSAGRAATIAFALLLIPSGFLALAWQERLDQVARQARAFVRFLAERDLHEALMRERQALVDEVRALAAQVPNADTAGRGPHG
jgi:1-acyl-sn-glycerol-3-phosphate acyltransferase